MRGRPRARGRTSGGSHGVTGPRWPGHSHLGETNERSSGVVGSPRVRVGTPRASLEAEIPRWNLSASSRAVTETPGWPTAGVAPGNSLLPPTGRCVLFCRHTSNCDRSFQTGPGDGTDRVCLRTDGVTDRADIDPSDNRTDTIGLFVRVPDVGAVVSAIVERWCSPVTDNSRRKPRASARGGGQASPLVFEFAYPADTTTGPDGHSQSREVPGHRPSRPRRGTQLTRGCVDHLGETTHRVISGPGDRIGRDRRRVAESPL